MRKFYFIVLLLSGIYANTAFSQPGWNLKENYVWPCIMDSALDFNSGSPVKVKSGIEVFWCTGHTNETSFASVCDNNGRLLFYTDGDSIWNRNHNVMPNGYIISDTWGAQQGLLIVPVLSNPNQYYLFSLKGVFPTVVLSYTIIDLSLDGGLGDVVPGTRNIPLDSNLAITAIATPGNNCDIWVISHDASDTLFKSYHITTEGIDTAVVQSRAGIFASFDGFLASCLAVSPDRKKIAMAGWGFTPNQAVALFDFDANTGKISNTLVLDSDNTYSLFPYGVCFSPDNTKLYFTSSDTESGFMSGIQPYIGHIHQYEVNLPTPAAIVSSGIQLPQEFYYFWGGMISPPLRLGPDGKIYLPADDAYCPPEIEPNDTIPYIGCINYPNVKGAACDFQPHVIVVSSPPSSLLSPLCATGSPLYIPGSELLPYALGADYVKPLIGDSTYLRFDTTICLPLKDSVVLTGPSGYFQYLWNDGNTDSVRKIWNPGTYYVHAQTYCHIRVDTFVVKEVNVNFSLGPDTAFCDAPFPYKLSTSLAKGTNYRWQDGSTNSYYVVTKSGEYSLVTSNAQCRASDSITVTFVTPPHLGNDTSLCNGQPIDLLLQPIVPAGGVAIWSNGTFDNTLLVRDTGAYWITVTAGPCQFSDTINVSTELCDCAIEIPSAFSPNGDGLNDIFRPIVQPGCEIKNYRMEVFNRWGQMIYMSYRPEEGWDGTFNGVRQEIGAYQYIIRFDAGTKANKNFRKGDITLIR